jgi:hypothetical protein
MRIRILAAAVEDLKVLDLRQEPSTIRDGLT